MSRNDADWEVAVIGAGPVGLLLANLLGQAGLRTLIADRRLRGPETSMAIGITPPSLAVIRNLGLDRNFVDCGVRVEKALVFGDRRQLGELRFDTLPEPWPFILSLPQAETVRLLEAHLAAWPNVELRRGWALCDFRQDQGGIEIDLIGPDADRATLRAGFLVGCDGYRSLVRSRLGLDFQAADYPQTYLMGDHFDRSRLGTNAALFFSRRGPVESFPLPEGLRRWVVLTERFEEQPAAGLLEDLVGERTGICLDPAAKCFESPFRVGRLLAAGYHSGRVALCGDAAHRMSPIGGQGMNVGFGDARRLALALERILRRGGDAGDELAGYGADRHPAASTAIARAARAMGFGACRGRFARLWRSPAIRLLLSPLLRDRLPPYFAMLNLPGTIEPESAFGNMP